uniref:Uncharacterized protein n=1 Tax=Oryza glumipatula TaxID=40148 RepID=A0A0D9YS86_9ORYZ
MYPAPTSSDSRHSDMDDDSESPSMLGALDRCWTWMASRLHFLPSRADAHAHTTTMLVCTFECVFTDIMVLQKLR